MKTQLQKLYADLTEAFWLLPAFLVVLGIVLAAAIVELDRSELVPRWLIDDGWIYSGGATGARTLLGAVASSTIGVAGTVFSITIAALSLAANQMGPRLLRNFTRDRGNQATLGIFLGTFSYALIVLRAVRTTEEGEFVPHLALSFGILLALACVATLVYFVGHMAGRINVDVVIDLVTTDVGEAVRKLAKRDPHGDMPASEIWSSAETVADMRSGYLQHLDAEGLADWARENNVAVRLLVRPGNYVFRGAPFAQITKCVSGTTAALRDATALGHQRVTSIDIEYAVRQLVEVAVRALSPGVNDPHTAIHVLDRLGSVLCDLVPLHLPTGVHTREGRVVLLVPSVDYEGLTDTMFHMIRQSALSNPAVLIKLLEVLTAVITCERDEHRRRCLKRHAGLVIDDAEKAVTSPSDLGDVRHRFESLQAAAASATRITAHIES